jgi:serine/threonine protein kinase
MGLRYGSWEVIRELGKGGQGTVYLAKSCSDENNDTLPRSIVDYVRGIATIDSEPVRLSHADKLLSLIGNYTGAVRNTKALKVMHDQIKRDEKAKERLAREIAILSESLHPNIIPILDSSVPESWFVTEYYTKGNLGQHKNMYRGDPLKALQAIRPIVDAVAVIHDKGLVHRDIKPENIFAQSEETLILGDFGLVHVLDSGNRLSDTYENVGSRDWMPPWALGMKLDEVKPTFDVFCLGKVLWAMASGKTKLTLWYFDRPQFDLTKLFTTNVCYG